MYSMLHLWVSPSVCDVLFVTGGQTFLLWKGGQTFFVGGGGGNDDEMDVS